MGEKGTAPGEGEGTWRGPWAVLPTEVQSALAPHQHVCPVPAHPPLVSLLLDELVWLSVGDGLTVTDPLPSLFSCPRLSGLSFFHLVI